MATKKKSSPSASKSKASSSKSAPKKPKASTTKKATASKKSSSTKGAKSTPKSHDPLHHVTNSALTFVDQAAELLRTGIHAGEEMTDKARTASRKKALSLIDRASSTLNKIVDTGAKTARRIIR